MSANLQHALRELLSVEAIEVRLDAIDRRVKVLEKRHEHLADLRRENDVLREKLRGVGSIVELLKPNISAGTQIQKILDYIHSLECILAGPT